MSDLASQFQAAQDNIKLLDKRPDNNHLLKLYSLYKQATLGDNTAKLPPFSDIIARAKWNAWTSLKGVSTDAAMQRYIDLVETMRKSG